MIEKSFQEVLGWNAQHQHRLTLLSKVKTVFSSGYCLPADVALQLLNQASSQLLNQASSRLSEAVSELGPTVYRCMGGLRNHSKRPQ